jgi:hypothetical protein
MVWPGTKKEPFASKSRSRARMRGTPTRESSPREIMLGLFDLPLVTQDDIASKSKLRQTVGFSGLTG